MTDGVQLVEVKCPAGCYGGMSPVGRTMSTEIKDNRCRCCRGQGIFKGRPLTDDEIAKRGEFWVQVKV